jgi:hypothetical protein
MSLSRVEPSAVSIPICLATLGSFPQIHTAKINIPLDKRDPRPTMINFPARPYRKVIIYNSFRIKVAYRKSCPIDSQDLRRVVRATGTVRIAAVLTFLRHRRHHVTRGFVHPTKDGEVSLLVETGRIGPNEEEL